MEQFTTVFLAFPHLIMANIINEDEMSIRDILGVILKRTEKIEMQMAQMSLVMTKVDIQEEAIVGIKKDLDRIWPFDNRIAKLEQRSRISNIEVVGMPTTVKENTDAIILKISELTGAKLVQEDIIISHRVPSFGDKQIPNIVCQLKDRKVKNQFLKCVKQYTKDNNKLMDSTMFVGVDRKLQKATNIFVNEHLTKENKNLLTAVKRRKDEVQWKYVWVRDGNIFARKTDTSDVIKVDQMSDVNKMM